jgi:uncharacterized protein (DUF885 family)
MRRAAAVALLLTAVAARVRAQADVDSLAARVRKLADTYLAAYFEHHPDEATLDGAAGMRHDALPDDSPIALARWQAREDAWLTELRRIDPAPLAGRSEWIAYGVARESLEGSIAMRVCRYELWNVSHVNRGWLPILTALADLQPVGTDELRAQMLARWSAIPAYLARETVNQREGLALGYSAPQGNVRIVLKQLDQLLDLRVDRSPLYGPALRDSTPAFRAELRRLLETSILPAMRAYRQFLAKEYLPRARKTIGVAANPSGAACYRATIRATTGFALSPDSIHRLGRATVTALEAEMRAITERSFGSRDVTPVLKRLRNDRKYAFRTREQILAYAEAALERARAAAPHWFGLLPRAPVVIQPYPAFRERENFGEWDPPAEDGTRPGTVYISAYDPKHKARADVEPLVFHEAIPGHHLQGAIALERGTAIPAIARYFWSPGFGEGWGEYAEQLADEMGIYSSDTARLGALADLTLSAALLVVDTGINAFGWSRDDGIQYLEAHTRVPAARAEAPVDRYPVWPAQGLSYALGRLEIRRLRALAEQGFGAKFDIKAFHDRVLQDGAVPLPLLREKLGRWIAPPR